MGHRSRDFHTTLPVETLIAQSLPRPDPTYATPSTTIGAVSMRSSPLNDHRRLFVAPSTAVSRLSRRYSVVRFQKAGSVSTLRWLDKSFPSEARSTRRWLAGD